MSSTPNTVKGRQFLLQILDQTDLANPVWKSIGGVKSKDHNADNPVADTTSQSTEGDATESQYTGYSTFTFNGSGVVDLRNGDDIAAYKVLSRAAMNGERRARLRFVDPTDSIEGIFQITNLQKQAEQQGLLEFTFSAQSAKGVTYS